MNFLAHLYCSGDAPKLMIGNFIGDFVKGRDLHNYEPEVVKGILLHRAIDVFTDSHETVLLSKKRLRAKYRHFAGVIVDIFYDHFLADAWPVYHPIPLADFADRAYATVRSYTRPLPDDVRHMLPYMIEGNWLVSYASVEGVRRALTGLSRRTIPGSRLEEAHQDLASNYDAFKLEFDTFMPRLKQHADEWVRLNSQLPAHGTDE